MITLYQFPISHFCEKVRWALDIKGLDYTKRSLLPGLHRKITKPLTGKSSVPVVVDDGQALGDSSAIISMLDTRYPTALLTPEDPELRSQALAWEKELDDGIGVNIRLMCYHTLLDHPKIVIPFFTQGGPWYGRIFMTLLFPKMAMKMRSLMRINEASTAEATAEVDTLVAKMLAQLATQDYLVGDRFSRADLTAAALFAPLAKPAGYGLVWPDTYPEELEALRRRYHDILAWVNTIYQKHR